MPNIKRAPNTPHSTPTNAHNTWKTRETGGTSNQKMSPKLTAIETIKKFNATFINASHPLMHKMKHKVQHQEAGQRPKHKPHQGEQQQFTRGIAHLSSFLSVPQ
jgi:hypothetical protein